jgi:3-hydroxyacyl-CoA dehydrogenase
MMRLPTLTVCGSGAAGRAIAADCAFKGSHVTVYDLPAFEASMHDNRPTPTGSPLPPTWSR